jgi:8-oxo-dGTP diphosphatase
MTGGERSLIEVVAGIVVEGGRVLIAQRRADQSFPLNWEFPGGKCEAGESAEAALDREFREELGIGVAVLGLYEEVCYRDPAGVEVRVVFLRARKRRGKPRPLQVAAVDWVDAAGLVAVEFIPHNRRIVARLVEELAGDESGGRGGEGSD